MRVRGRVRVGVRVRVRVHLVVVEHHQLAQVAQRGELGEVAVETIVLRGEGVGGEGEGAAPGVRV